VKNLTWKLVLPLSILSFATFTKWWYVLPVDAPDTMMSGFPLPFVCEGWHTSLSLQIFLAEFFIDLLTYFSICFLLIYLINRFVTRIKIPKVFAIILLTLSGLISIAAIGVASERNNIIELKRPWDMEVMTTGYRFVWQFQERPDYYDYNPIKIEKE